VKLLEWQEKMIQAAKKLEFVFANDKLDIEFAIIPTRLILGSSHLWRRHRLNEVVHGEEILYTMMDWG